MWAQTQPVSDRPRPQQLPVSPRPPESGSPVTAVTAATSSASIVASLDPSPDPPPYRTFLDLDDEPAGRPYQPKLVLPSALPSDTTSTENVDRHAVQQAWPPPRNQSLMNHSPTPWLSERMDNICICVIGSLGVGKSSFIQRALRLKTLPTATTSSVKQDLEGIPYVVSLIEYDLEYFDMEDWVVPGQQVQWPKQINGQALPRVDGALVLYDVTNKDSIRDLPPILSALSAYNVPHIIVATKCDTPENLRQLDVAGVARLAASYPWCVGEYRTSANAPASQRDCLQAILKATLAHKRGTLEKSEASVSRRRAASAANLDAPPDTVNGRPRSQQHSRASSDLSLLRGVPPASSDSYYRQPPRSPRLDNQAPGQPNSAPSPSSDAPEERHAQTVSSMLRTPGGIRLDAGGDTFLDVDESDTESYRHSDDIPLLQRNDEGGLGGGGGGDRPGAGAGARSAGVSFDELVDRLVAQRMSRADANFADTFLCLYRKFAAPARLFGALRARLDRVRDDRATHYLLKTEAQLRVVEVVAKWVALYPGDFARPATRRGLDELVRQLATEPVFAAAAHQMRVYLELSVAEDDDTGWARSDDVEEGGGGPHDAAAALLLERKASERGSEMSERVSSLQLDESGSSDHRRPSLSSELSDRGGGAGGRTPARFQFHSYEDYEREAATMVPTATFPLNKIRYRIFMEIDADDIADEITRIDWVMFSSIRIRDFVRHVSLGAEEKERCRSLKNVNRMIGHFNHVAKWVANMVLIRDKAKHRAPCLEKFMVIAQKLRKLNNYNGLAAVLAGINGTAVHRLAQTRALVSPDVQKQFARLVLLMGTQKSHFAYRLAWENSPLPRIPFIPLHRRDLVSAEEGSRTFVGPNGDRINWRKFDVLGEVLLPLMKSQGQPYPNLHRHEASRELILDCKMITDDEDIYQRSVQVESGSGGAAESSKKKFPWLAK